LARRRIVVTGGAGFIGSRLVDEIVRDETGEIVVVDNLRRGDLDYLAGARERISFVKGDVRDFELLRGLFTGVDLVYHLAAQSNVLGAEQDADYAFTTNVAGTFNVLQAARERGVSRVVFTSSREVYGDVEQVPVSESSPVSPKNAYGTSKAVGEMYCRLYAQGGLDVRIVRLANVYGPRDRGRVIPLFVERALHGETLTIYGGDQVVDFVWVGDVVDVLRQAGMGPPIDGPLNVGSGRGITVAELAELVIASVGSNSTVQVLPKREVEVVRFVADTTRARRLFGLSKPATPLGHLDEVIAWTREHAHVGERALVASTTRRGIKAA
jgi:UDP-glucose 4-epimerase